MRKALIIIAMMLALAFMLVGCGSEIEAPAGPYDYPQGSLVQVADAFATAMTGVEANYYVYLPPGHNATGTQYPVLYLLHGFGGDEEYFVKIFSAASAADQLIAEGDIQPFVIVMPNGKNPLGGSFYTDSPHAAVNAAETHIMGIIAEVEASLDFNVMTTEDGKAIAGHSMGGFGALSMAMNMPNTFKNIGVLSAPISFWGTMPASDAYKGMEEVLPSVLAETGYDEVLAANPAGDYALWREMMFPTADRRITAFMFAMSAAFSPFDMTAPYMPTLIDSMWSVNPATGDPMKIPIGLNLPLAIDGTVDMTTWTRWMAFDPVNRLSTQGASLAGRNLLLDCGASDDLGLYGGHQVLAGAIEAFAVPVESIVLNTYPDATNSPASHTGQVYDRLKVLFEWVDGKF
jgi:S-formylglutathione hydrolase FrmB